MLDNDTVGRMIEEVKGMITLAVSRSGLPVSEWDDVAGDIRLSLVTAARRFDPAGAAKWSTYANTVIGNVLRRAREQHGERGRVGLAAGDGPGAIDFNTVADPSGPDPDRPHDAPGDAGGERDDGLSPEAGADLDDAAEAFEQAFRRVMTGRDLDVLGPGSRRLVELLIDGNTLSQAACQLGQPVKVVRATLRSAVGQLARAGRVPPELAAACGVDAARVATETDRVAIRQRVAERRPKVAELAAAGRTNAEIAAALGTNREAIRRDRAALGKRAAAPTPAAQAEPAEVPAPELPAVGTGEGEPAAENRIGLGIVPTIRPQKPAPPTPPTVRQRVAVYFSEGLSEREAAERGGFSRNTVKTYYYEFRARARRDDRDNATRPGPACQRDEAGSDLAV